MLRKGDPMDNDIARLFYAAQQRRDATRRAYANAYAPPGAPKSICHAGRKALIVSRRYSIVRASRKRASRRQNGGVSTI